MALAAIVFVVGIVEVGQSQHVAELMADGAYAIECGPLVPAIELGAAGIAPQILAVLPQVAIIVGVVY